MESQQEEGEEHFKESIRKDIEEVGEDASWRVRYLLMVGDWADRMNHWLKRECSGILAQTIAPLESRQHFNGMFESAMSQTAGWEWKFLSCCAASFGSLHSQKELLTE